VSYTKHELLSPSVHVTNPLFFVSPYCYFSLGKLCVVISVFIVFGMCLIPNAASASGLSIPDCSFGLL